VFGLPALNTAAAGDNKMKLKLSGDMIPKINSRMLTLKILTSIQQFGRQDLCQECFWHHYPHNQQQGRKQPGIGKVKSI
jgi:hypothetical protein